MFTHPPMYNSPAGSTLSSHPILMMDEQNNVPSRSVRSLIASGLQRTGDCAAYDDGSQRMEVCDLGTFRELPTGTA